MGLRAQKALPAIRLVSPDMEAAHASELEANQLRNKKAGAKAKKKKRSYMKVQSDLLVKHFNSS